MGKKAKKFDPRQEMHRADYEVFHYHDAKMQEVPLHHHDFYEVYLFLSGSVEYTVEGRNYTLMSGDILLIDPMELHRPKVAPDKAYERIVLWINADYMDEISEPDCNVRRCFEGGHNLYRGKNSAPGYLMRQLSEAYDAKMTGTSLYTKGLFYQLMAELLRMTEGASQADDTSSEPELVTQVLAYIRDHYRDELTLESLAEHFFFSKYHLSHLFSQATGTSVYHYILLKRLQHAKQMLSEGAGPGQACQSCGFQDYANFYRSFKSVYGAGPSEFRA